MNEKPAAWNAPADCLNIFVTRLSKLTNLGYLPLRMREP